MKKVFKAILSVSKFILFLFAVSMMIFTFVSVTQFNKTGGKGLFGYKPFIVLSDSMKETNFAAGDVAVSKVVDTTTLQPGDIITFKSDDPKNYGIVLTHKIRKKTTYRGQDAYVTYGTTTGQNDNTPVPVNNIIGKYVFHVQKAGYVFQYLKSTAGYFILIFIPFFILILIEGMRFLRLIKQYRQEQQTENEEQRALILEMEQKAEQMIKELEILRNQA